MRHVLLVVPLLLLLGLAQAQSPARILSLPAAQAAQARSSSLFVLPDARLLVANPLSDSLALLDVQGRIVAEIALGAGSGPTQLSLSADSRSAVVLESQGHSLAWLDLREQALLRRAPWPATPPTRVLALDGQQALIQGYQVQDGRWQESTSPCGAPLALWGGLCLGFAPLSIGGTGQTLRLSRLEQPSFRQDVGGGGVGLALALDARRGRAYVLYSQAALSQEHWIDEIDLATLGRLRRFWLPAADGLRAAPSVLLYDGRLGRLYLAYPLEQRVVALDLASGLRVGEARTGAYPDGLALSLDATTLYARSAADQTITVIGTDFMIVRDTWPSSDLALDGRLRLGARLYHSVDSPSLSQGERACASCHASVARPTWSVPPAEQPAAWWDEHIAQQQGGTGLDSLERAALLAYVQHMWLGR